MNKPIQMFHLSFCKIDKLKAEKIVREVLLQRNRNIGQVLTKYGIGKCLNERLESLPNVVTDKLIEQAKETTKSLNLPAAISCFNALFDSQFHLIRNNSHLGLFLKLRNKYLFNQLFTALIIESDIFITCIFQEKWTTFSNKPSIMVLQMQ